MDYSEIDFDKELEAGKKTYDEKLGKWWQSRSKTEYHKKAYKDVVKFIRSRIKQEPGLIIDYACGAGNIMEELASVFPDSKLMGLDGSDLLLKEAKKKLPKAEFVKTGLPNFSLPEGEADLVIFAFPNIVPDPDEQPYYDKHGYEDEGDTNMADYLSEAREPDPEDETVTEDSDDLYDTLLSNKVISRNIRKLLKKGGICIRVEYANDARDELTPLVQQRQAFEEGSFGGTEAEQIFLLEESKFFESKVIEDVFHQTKDKDDLEGGYFVTILKAI